MLILFDSGHYLQYVKIFENRAAFATWDIVRGPSFPVLIHLSNIFFGKTAMGLLIFSFIFYLIMLFFSKKILDIASKGNKKTKNILIILFFLLVIINPIIYGYYHSLLTEFVAMTVSVMSCFFAWKLFETVENDKKPHFILLSLYFIIMVPLAYFLKQPFVSIALFPLIAVVFLALIGLKSWQKKLQIVSVFFISLITLVSSITVWNGVLKSKGIELNSGNESTNILGYRLIAGLNRFNFEGNFSAITYDKFEVLDNKGKVIGKMQIENNKSGLTSAFSGIKFLINAISRYPDKVFNSYLNNYLGISNVYRYNKEGFILDNKTKSPKFEILACRQNCIIATGINNEKSNIFHMTPELYEEVVDYEQKIDPPFLFKLLFNLNEKPSIFFVNLLMISLPFVWMSSLVFLLCQVRKDKKQKIQNPTRLYMVFILLTYSLLHILVHVVTATIIDRYASPTYIAIILADLLLLAELIEVCKGRKNFKETTKKIKSKLLKYS
ncbi:MAG: hypothetical protein PHP96_02640 [Candidatus Dojkabacteria bacterium]|nr:hypothetical protein [Candidatus Dojkabacteria bacterium]MDD4561046.1 hypothetical protein [Candidatus Dojkabacteria bacterium]